MNPRLSNEWPTRLPLLILVLVIGVGALGGAPAFVMTVPMAVLLVALCVATRSRGSEAAFTVPAGLVVAVVSVGAPIQLVAIALPNLSLVALAGVVAAAAISTIAAALVPRWFYPHLALQGGFLVVLIRSLSPRGDVRVVLEDSIAGLLRGENPYSRTFPNPYSIEDTKAFWPPEFISGDRIDVGFPYLPGALFGDLPGHLLGDVRYASAAAILVTTALAWSLCTETVGRAMVAALPTCGISMVTVLGYWVEPLMLLGVAVLAWSMARGHRHWAVVGLALLLTVKQYAIVLLPLEKLVRKRLGMRVIVASVVASAALIFFFFALSPTGFWRAVVALALNHPFRPDSTSLSVDLVGAGVPLPKWAISAASLVAGFAVAAWVRWTAPISTTWTCLGVGLALLASVLLSQAGHINYYFIIHGSLVIGLATWPRELAASAAGPGQCGCESLLVERHQ